MPIARRVLRASARVPFGGDHYAGIWQGKRPGGFMSGRLEKQPEQ